MGRVFIATTGDGLMRAEESAAAQFTVERLLPGMNVSCLAGDPREGMRVYAGGHDIGILRSDDGGRTWQTAGLAGLTVKAIAASPIRPGLLYAGTKPARLYVSRDGGDRWQELGAFRHIRGRALWFSPAEPPFSAYVQAIAPSPTDPERLVVGVEFGATVLSCDGGQTWTEHRRGALRDCHGLGTHLTDGNWVYQAGGTGGGAAFSRDSGRTWINAGNGLDRHYGWAVAADPADPAVWYVSVAHGPSEAHGARHADAAIFRRDGAGWQRLTGGLPEPLAHMPYALITDAAAPGTLYAGLSNGDLWHTRDRGESWRQLPVNLGAIHRALTMV